MNWKAGDWVVFDLRIGQIKSINDGYEEFTDGTIGTSGQIADRFRPLTIRNKRTAEAFDYYYNEWRRYTWRPQVPGVC